MLFSRDRTDAWWPKLRRAFFHGRVAWKSDAGLRRCRLTASEDVAGCTSIPRVLQEEAEMGEEWIITDPIVTKAKIAIMPAYCAARCRACEGLTVWAAVPGHGRPLGGSSVVATPVASRSFSFVARSGFV